MRILIVDDEPDILLVLSRWLQNSGHSAITTLDPREVMELIETQNVDLVFLDLMMPRVNGLQLIPGIRERNPKLPIVVISAVGDMRLAVQAAKEGVEDYLLKPIDFNKLDALLKRLSAVA
jgi:DNA-binding NtrC family response regulator